MSRRSRLLKAECKVVESGEVDGEVVMAENIKVVKSGESDGEIMIAEKSIHSYEVFVYRI
jgi:cytoskeletal protein CcmA (bactofilin family)